MAKLQALVADRLKAISRVFLEGKKLLFRKKRMSYSRGFFIDIFLYSSVFLLVLPRNGKYHEGYRQQEL